MAKKPKRRLTPRSAAAQAPAEPGAVAAQNVILERVEEQLRVVAEGVTMTRETLERKIENLDQRLSSRMDTLEFAVRKNSADIQKNSADIQSLTEKLDTKADAGRVANLERRVVALEA